MTVRPQTKVQKGPDTNAIHRGGENNRHEEEIETVISFHGQPECSSASTSDLIHLAGAGHRLGKRCSVIRAGGTGRNLAPAQRASAVEGNTPEDQCTQGHKASGGWGRLL